MWPSVAVSALCAGLICGVEVSVPRACPGHSAAVPCLCTLVLVGLLIDELHSSVSCRLFSLAGHERLCVVLQLHGPLRAQCWVCAAQGLDVPALDDACRPVTVIMDCGCGRPAVWWARV